MLDDEHGEGDCPWHPHASRASLGVRAVAARCSACCSCSRGALDFDGFRSDTGPSAAHPSGGSETRVIPTMPADSRTRGAARVTAVVPMPAISTRRPRCHGRRPGRIGSVRSRLRHARAARVRVQAMRCPRRLQGAMQATRLHMRVPRRLRPRRGRMQEHRRVFRRHARLSSERDVRGQRRQLRLHVLAGLRRRRHRRHRLHIADRGGGTEHRARRNSTTRAVPGDRQQVRKRSAMGRGRAYGAGRTGGRSDRCRSG